MFTYLPRFARYSLFLTCITPFALPAQDASDIIEEIIVVAQKREQSLLDVGIAVTAFTDSQLRQLRMRASEDLANQTPGLQATSFSGDPTVMLLAIRGVGQNDFTDHHESPTAAYEDEVYISALGGVGLQLFDLERVEVLRGPQGTLFGRNATGGLVHYIPQQPGREFDAFANLTVGDYDMMRLEAAIGGPLGDTTSARLAFLSNTVDGYLKNREGPDVHEIDHQAVRAQLAWDISDAASLRFKITSARDNNSASGAFQQLASIPGVDGLGEYLPLDVNADYFGLGSCDGCDPLGYRDDDNDPHAGEYDQTGVLDRDLLAAAVFFEWSRDNITFESITDLSEIDKRYGEDSDGSPNPLAYFETDQDTQQFSQEFRLTGINDPLTWTAGFYYLDIDGDYGNVFGSPVFDATEINTYSLATESMALFGQIEYAFSDQWRLITGLRWTREEKRFEYQPDCVGTGCLGFFVFPGSGVVSDIGGFNSATVGALTKRDEDNWAGKLQLEWLADNAIAYAGITRGHKAGGFNAPLDGLLFADEMIYEEEILTNYEIGYKSVWLDRRLNFNAAAFYYDYEDKQAFTFSGFTTYLLNRPAEAYGGEIEFFMKADGGWDFGLGIALLEANVDNVPLPSGREAEQSMSQAPELTVNGVVRKSWDLGSGSIALQFDGFYVGEQYFNTINHPTARAESYTVFNGSLAYTAPSGNWDVNAFVENIADEEFATYAIDVSAFGYSLLSFGRPRWYGLEFRYRWER
jgi:iron complex outermembrane receptor protein